MGISGNISKSILASSHGSYRQPIIISLVAQNMVDLGLHRTREIFPYLSSCLSSPAVNSNEVGSKRNLQNLDFCVSVDSNN